MQNEPNFMDAKTNVTSGLTTPYETARICSTEKTNPISSTLPNAGCIAKEARKACQQVLAIANRFFETVARINEGPLGENRGDFGGKRGKTGEISTAFTRLHIYSSTHPLPVTRQTPKRAAQNSTQNLSQTDRKFVNMRHFPPRYTLVQIVYIARRLQLR